jgi:arabinogalactan endo-1,4-beta-galactosidase
MSEWAAVRAGIVSSGRGLLLLCGALLLATAAARAEPSAFILGADLSFLPQLQSLGAEFRVDGKPLPPLAIFRAGGFGAVRLRLWHSPSEPWHSTAATLAFAREASAAGFDIMLDFHYSDTWADPGHQEMPAAWRDLPFAALRDSVGAYTRAVVRRFCAAGVVPRWVQVGNEIDGGMLWDTGRVGWAGSAWDTPRQWDNLAALVGAAADGVREGARDAKAAAPIVVIHAAAGGDSLGCRRLVDGLLARGVAFDAIGVSWYRWWHGPLAGLAANLRGLAARYRKPLLVVETAYPWTLDDADGVGNFVTSATPLEAGYPATPQGQARLLRELCARVAATPGGLGAGLFYWEPDFVAVPGGPGDPSENLALFDFRGEALPALEAWRPPTAGH